MRDLANLSFPSSSYAAAHCLPTTATLSPDSSDSKELIFTDPDTSQTCYGEQQFQAEEIAGNVSNGNVVKVSKRGKTSANLDEHVRNWVRKKVEAGVPESRCSLPFLSGARRAVECLVCCKFIDPGDEIRCSVRACGVVYHSSCAKEYLRCSNLRKFKCPQHVVVFYPEYACCKECFVCKQRARWRCVRCITASHDKHAPWRDEVLHFECQPGRAICWRHPNDWRLDRRDVFGQLPIPYVDEDFKIGLSLKEIMNKAEPPPYVHIRRNIYLVKKKRDPAGSGVGCTNCGTTCSRNCVCRVQCISCSRSCHCDESCSNRPFRKDKKLKIVKTELCGWGVEAAEPLKKGDFVIEYSGEVISDALCEQRLWNMKYRGEKNFYMCEIQKDFTIDATFKGNASRFLNHGCDPNCNLEKWEVDGETRVGVFAARRIEIGEPLTYDYRFVQFGPEEKCHCGASNCQGYLGTKRKATVNCFDFLWGSKRRRQLSLTAKSSWCMTPES